MTEKFGDNEATKGTLPGTHLPVEGARNASPQRPSAPSSSTLRPQHGTVIHDAHRGKASAAGDDLPRGRALGDLHASASSVQASPRSGAGKHPRAIEETKQKWDRLPTRLMPVDMVPQGLPSGEVLSRREKVYGAVTAGLLHVGLPLLYAVVLLFASGAHSAQPPAFEKEDVVEARFVQLGKEPDPDRLPEREVPIKESAPPEDVIPVAEEAPQKPPPEPEKEKPKPKEKEEKPPEPDFLNRLQDRAQAFAEIAKRAEREGSPDGIAEGDAKIARAGDVYRGKLYLYFRRGWRVPNVLEEEERRKLATVVDIQIGRDLRVLSYRIVDKSGDGLFDQSVTERMEDAVQSRTPIPPPPEEIADQYLGQTIRLRMLGRDSM